jgi:hypothetical protein
MRGTGRQTLDLHKPIATEQQLLHHPVPQPIKNESPRAAQGHPGETARHQLLQDLPDDQPLPEEVTALI